MNSKLTITLPIRTVSEANQREHHMARDRRRVEQQEITTLYLEMHGASITWPQWVFDESIAVRFTRIAPRMLDSDNLQGSMKHIRDALAHWLGVDDREGTRVTWLPVEQERGEPKEYAVRVEIERCDDD